jgi:predicted nucleotide-binding protein
MTADELRDFLAEQGVGFGEEEIQNGYLFRCESGEIFAAYNTGKVVCQGRPTEISKAVKGWKRQAGGTAKAKPISAAPLVQVAVTTADKPVFIVYGHDMAVREGLELVLHKMGLKPIVLENLPADGDTVIEKLERYLGEHGNVGFACALLTPDDEGHEAGKPAQRKYRARQNVILELGMVLARLGRRRVLILIKESVEQPSDIAGLIYLRFKERVDELKATLFKDLKGAGYNPDPKGL